MVLAGYSGWASAQSAPAYPTRVIRFLSPPAGSNVDLIARVIAQGVASEFGQSVVVENHPDLVAMKTAVNATPDGYTVLLATSAVWIKPLMQKVDYDPVKDLIPITLATTAPSFLFTVPSVPAKNVKELIAYAKANPGKLNYGMAGQGTSGHLAAELFKNMAGIDIVRIAYNGSGAMISGMLANQIQLSFSSASTGMPHVPTGKLLVLGVGGTKPSALAPDVPTIASQGLPGYQIQAEQAMWVPAGTPKGVVDRLSTAVLKVLANPEVKKKFLSDGTETLGNTPDQVAAYIKADMVKWGKLVKDAHLQAD
jgi:tripartite-type tricarboxylate transporter receptor subunit TctC